MLPIGNDEALSRDCFQSEWCRLEPALMHHREKSADLRNDRNSGGLIIPLVIDDGDHFPPEIQAMQSEPLHRFANPFIRTDSPKQEELAEILKDRVCPAIERARRPDVVVQRLAPNGVALAPNIACPAADCRAYNLQPCVLYRSRYGIGCLGNVPPGTTPNPERPPQSYRVQDVGRPGFPTLTSNEAALIKRVRHDVTSDTLRIAWVDWSSTPNGFIIFDASDGPCTTGQRYALLNGSGNEIYFPGENPYGTIAAPDCFPTERPWLRTLERHS